MTSQDSATHILYHYPYSICSIQVRYAFANRGEAKYSKQAIRLEERAVDIGPAREQLTEHYLCDINQNGEVPVLVAADGSSPPLPESVDITYKLAENYPTMIPAECSGEVKHWLAELHKISFFALTFTGKPQNAQGSISFLQKQLDENGTSERYRKVIEYKIKRIQNSKIKHLEEDNVEASISKTKDIMAEVERRLKASSTDWIFSTPKPTAFDAHFVVFVARLQDVKRENLTPERVIQFADFAMGTPEWEEVMQGRKTAPPMVK